MLQKRFSRNASWGGAVRSPLLQGHRGAPGGLPQWRSRFVLVLIFLAFGSLAGRAAWIQVVDHRFYAEQGRKRFERTMTISAARGNIVDRDGRLLAISKPVRSIYAIPAAMNGPLPADKLVALAALLAMSPETLAKRFEGERSFVYLKRRVPMAVAAKVEALGIPEVRTTEAWQRYYPDGAASAQIVGFADIDEQGQEGVEAGLNARLMPQAGHRQVIRNRLGEIVDNDVMSVPVPGEQVRLTIDSRIQQAAYRALQHAIAEHHAYAGGAVVIDARNGEILAMANWPSYDPNDVRARGGARVRNRVIADVFEPGSTIKPIHVAQALQHGWVTPDTIIDVAPGAIRLGRFTVRDTAPRTALSVRDVLRYSSNVGMVRMMAQETPEQMWSSLRRSGLGSAPDLPFPGVAEGLLRPVSRWSGIDQAALSYGYGTAVSLLQLARAYTQFGPSGEVLTLKLAYPPDEPTAGDTVGARASGTPSAPRASLAPPAPIDDLKHSLALSPQVSAQMRALLHSVAEPGGTAHRARVDGFVVGAKTGTTRKMGTHGYEKNEYLATAVGIVPVADPRFVVAVMIDRPQGKTRGGASVAVPVLATVMQETLRLSRIAPDYLSAVQDVRTDSESASPG